jgi:hypothetical protein
MLGSDKYFFDLVCPKLNQSYHRGQTQALQILFSQDPAVAFPVHEGQILQMPLARLIARGKNHLGIVISISGISRSEVLGSEECCSFLSPRAGKYRLSRPDALVVDKVSRQVYGLGQGSGEFLRLEGEARNIGRLVVGQRAHGRALRRGQWIGCTV